MRIILADLRGTDGVVTKDTATRDYGSRFKPFSRITRLVAHAKRQFREIASLQMAYLAAICARWGHEVRWTRDSPVKGDVALVLSSLVDYQREVAWARAMRSARVRVGFVGPAASAMPELFEEHADFIIAGEPEAATTRLARGEKLGGLYPSEPVLDLDTLPFPRWDLVSSGVHVRIQVPFAARPLSRSIPLLLGRGSPERYPGSPYGLPGEHRARSVTNILAELARLCESFPRPFVVFRDPFLFRDRSRCLALSDAVRARGLRVCFECEVELDRLDVDILDALHAAGLRAIRFSVDHLSAHAPRTGACGRALSAGAKGIVDYCRRLGIVTTGHYVLGVPEDDWNSVGATIGQAIELGSTFALFKLFTPYPATPLWQRLGPLVYERDWQRFDGFTPTFSHPNLSDQELRFLLGAAYTRFYMRPSYLADCLRVRSPIVREIARNLDARVSGLHTKHEYVAMGRSVAGLKNCPQV